MSRAGAFDKYVEDLKAKGWEIEMDEGRGGGMIQAAKDKVMV